MKKNLILFACFLGLFTSCEPEEGAEVGPAATACFNYTPETGIVSGDEVSFSSCSENASTYLWDFGDGGSATEENPFYVFQNAGEFQVQLIVSANGSADTSKVNIVVLPKEQPQLNEQCRLDELVVNMEGEEVSMLLSYDERDKVREVKLEGTKNRTHTFDYNEEGILTHISTTSSVYELEIQEGFITKALMYEEGKETDATMELVYSYDESGRISQRDARDLVYNDGIRTNYYNYTEAGELKITNAQDESYLLVTFDEGKRPFNDVLSAFLYIVYGDLVPFSVPGVTGSFTNVYFNGGDGREDSNSLINTYDENGKLMNAEAEEGGRSWDYSYICE